MHILLAERNVSHVSSVLDFFVQENDKKLVLVFPYYEPYPLDNLPIEEISVMMAQLLQVPVSYWSIDHSPSIVYSLL